MKKTSVKNESHRRASASLVAATILLTVAQPGLGQPAAVENQLPRKPATAPSPQRAAPEATTYYWYDGDQRRALRIDPSQVADFRPEAAAEAAETAQGGASAEAEQSKSAASKATVEHPGEARAGKSRRRGPLRLARPSEKAMSADGLAAGVSPVLSDATAPADARALPGGVIVTLKAAPAGTDPATREAAARSQLVQAGLAPVRTLDPSGRVWLVASPAGLASLTMANRLHENGQFESATPNWWQARALK